MTALSYLCLGFLPVLAWAAACYLRAPAPRQRRLATSYKGRSMLRYSREA